MTTKPMHLSGVEIAAAIDLAVANGVESVGAITSAPTGNYTLTLGDTSGTVVMNDASANTVTVPPNSAVAFPVGARVRVVNAGNGKCTLTAGAGVTLITASAGEILDSHSVGELQQVAANTWVTSGGAAS